MINPSLRRLGRRCFLRTAPLTRGAPMRPPVRLKVALVSPAGATWTGPRLGSARRLSRRLAEKAKSADRRFRQRSRGTHRSMADGSGGHPGVQSPVMQFPSTLGCFPCRTSANAGLGATVAIGSFGESAQERLHHRPERLASLPLLRRQVRKRTLVADGGEISMEAEDPKTAARLPLRNATLLEPARKLLNIRRDPVQSLPPPASRLGVVAA